MEFKKILNNRKNKKGFYFTLDALFALTMLLVVIALLPYTSISNIDEHYQMSYIQEDALQILSTIKTSDINSISINNIVNNSIYNETLYPNDVLIETLSKLWATNSSSWGVGGPGVSRIDNAAAIADSFFGSAIGPRDNFGIFFNNGSGVEPVFIRGNILFSNAEDIVSSQQFISGVYKGREISGYSARAFLQRKERINLFYFGGYIGDGNITATVDLSNVTNITNVTLELAINHPFDLSINNHSVGNYAGSSDPNFLTPVTISFPESSFNYFENGTNLIEFKNTSEMLAISGGYVKIAYKTPNPGYTVAQKQYFPGIEGVINLYDSMYSSNTITSMNARLHYKINVSADQNTTLSLRIGNTTIYVNQTRGSVNDFVRILTDSEISASLFANGGLTYANLSNKTVPVRLGFGEFAGSTGDGVADVIIVTDVSGSMAWSIGQDDSGAPNNFPASQCGNLSNPNNKIFWSNNSRMSLARCLDIEFATIILNISGNKIGLVAYEASPIRSYVNLTSNLTLIVNGSSGISGYTANGGTAICAGIRKARIMLQQQSNSSRRKFLVVMTDGLTNYQCNDVNNESLSVCSPDLCTYSNSYCRPNNGFGCLYYIFPVFNSLERRGEIFNLSLSISNIPNALVVGESNNKRGFNFSDGRWVNSSTYISGFTSKGYSATIFNLTGDGKLTIITSSFSSTSPLGYTWNGTGWSSASIVIGLPAAYAVGEVVYNFSNNGKFTLFAGNSSGFISSYTWNGTGWASNASIVNGIGDQGTNTFPAVAFNVTGDGNWTMIIGRTSSTSPVGFYWNGSAWKSKSAYVNGLSGAGDSNYAYTPDFEYNLTNNRWYILLGVSEYEPFFFAWDSGKWYKTCGDAVSNHAADQAISDAGKVAALTNFNKTYAIGFGPIEYCPFAQEEMKDIAETGNGEYLVSKNSTQLRDIMKKWAEDIASLSYAEQRTNLTGNFSSILYNDSYIEYHYDDCGGICDLRYDYLETLKKFGSTIIFESGYFNPATGLNNFSFQEGYPIEVAVTSYSGSKWSKWLGIDNNSINGTNFVTVYNLNEYGINYPTLGDPFRINIPLVNVGNNNTLNLTIANSSSEVHASGSDKIFYTLLTLSNYSYSNVTSNAAGCNWTIQYRDGTNDNNFVITPIPANYTGQDICYYSALVSGGCANGTNNVLQYDAIAQATYLLLRKYDVNPDNCIVDTKLSDYNINTILLPSVPFLFYTKANFVSWR
ncbi:MAG: VWA domain-containing protein [Candidatus Pacearchaeota archaeon]|nr:VWA domain-containing protein [Candidatus Pacearchaeota archaeon]